MLDNRETLSLDAERVIDLSERVRAETRELIADARRLREEFEQARISHKKLSQKHRSSEPA